MRRLYVIAALASLGLGACGGSTGNSPPSSATNGQPHLYWANLATGTIGRANLDGTGVNQTFVAGIPGPCDVDVDGSHIYWADAGDLRQGYNGTTIGRANLDGSGVNDSFIQGAKVPCSVTVDRLHIYWANWDNNAGTTIGRANLDGSGLNQSFISLAHIPGGLTVDSAHIYWANWGKPGLAAENSDGTTIGRANLDGSGLNENFITGANVPDAVAVNGSYIYWTNQASGTIGRANLDGTQVNQNFITGAPGPADLVVDAGYIYWTNYGYPVPTLKGTTIGRAKLDGTQAKEDFITGAAAPDGLAIGT